MMMGCVLVMDHAEWMDEEDDDDDVCFDFDDCRKRAIVVLKIHRRSEACELLLPSVNGVSRCGQLLQRWASSLSKTPSCLASSTRSQSSREMRERKKL